jgi:hypothetical protein
MLIEKLKSTLPKTFRKRLQTLDALFKREFVTKRLSKKMKVKHCKLIEEIKNKDTIKVVFLVIQHSVWKVDSVFQQMQKDPLFDPIILICPYIVHGEERMMVDLNSAYDFFKSKNYPVVSSIKTLGTTYEWVKLEELQPDLIFFTNPHNITRPEYYADAYLNYLSCYVPYHHEVGSYSGNIDQYNREIHNMLWSIFVPHKCSKNTYNKYCVSKDSHVFVTGYPACEVFYENDFKKNVWKYQAKNKLKIIWAPHHTIIDKDLPYSNFLEYAEQFINLTNETRERIQWAFKPHPMLKSNLYLHPSWGKKRTDQYYDFWSESNNTQLEEGDYAKLFQQSDAMIHDSGSFLAEYIYLEKPVLYTIKTTGYKSFYNAFGLSALSCIKTAHNWDDVLTFVNALVDGQKEITPEHRNFIEVNIAPYFSEAKPSKVILNLIKTRLQFNER